MLTFNLYCLLTIISTSYFGYTLYWKENQLFVYTVYIAKSRFYFCIAINFFIMWMVVIGKLWIKLFYGEVRLSELSQVMEKLRNKVFSFLLLFLLFRPKFDLQKVVIIALYFFMSVLTLIAFKRSAYIVSSNEKSKKIQLKIVVILIILALVNYTLYTNFNINLSEIIKDSQWNKPQDLIIFYIFSWEFLRIFVKIMAKLYKLSVNLTSINWKKEWEHRLTVFSVISLCKNAIELFFTINLCYVCYSSIGTPISFIYDIFINLWSLLKLVKKIYDNYKSKHYINKLADYNQLVELSKIIGDKPEMTEEEKEKIKNEKVMICNICLCEIEKGKYWNCGHVFHLKCIKEWIIVNSNCPICKAQIINDKQRHSKYYNAQWGVKEDEHESNSHEWTDEDILEKLNWCEKNKPKSYIHEKNIDVEKYMYYKKIKSLLSKINDQNMKEIPISPGSISYSLPCEAVLDRGIDVSL